MPDKRGRFRKGEHWREPKPWWDKSWLEREYLGHSKSASEIAAASGCTENNILFWLAKHGIPRRTMREARAVKHWGLSGSTNGMYGKCGAINPHWRGGVTPERQALYSSLEWAGAVKEVWQRDPHKCRRCGIANGPQEKLHVHHVISFSEVGLRTAPANLVLLCKSCHQFVHSRRNKSGEFLRKEGAE